MQKGSQSFKFDIPVYIEQTASVVGEKESEGPLGRMFDVVIKDPMSGKDNWEQAESALQEAVVDKLLMKTSYKKEQIRYILSGDLLGQLIATSFGISKYEIPHFGIYSACSTFGEALSLGALIISAGAADRLICMASSHFASAEKQFRFPLEYGNQRPKASTWTVTGSGAAVITNERQPVAITGITTGKIIDYGVKDSMNMGACMAPAAADLIVANFKDFETDEKYYDRIITGDLGTVGREILINLVKEKGYDIIVLNTICNATEERQTEAAKIARDVDAMIVIGGRNSSNTQKLFEICKNECNNTYYIQTVKDLDITCFESIDSVGITAGASTPNKIIEEVQKNVRNEL